MAKALNQFTKNHMSATEKSNMGDTRSLISKLSKSNHEQYVRICSCLSYSNVRHLTNNDPVRSSKTRDDTSSDNRPSVPGQLSDTDGACSPFGN